MELSPVSGRRAAGPTARGGGRRGAEQHSRARRPARVGRGCGESAGRGGRGGGAAAAAEPLTCPHRAAAAPARPRHGPPGRRRAAAACPRLPPGHPPALPRLRRRARPAEFQGERGGPRCGAGVPGAPREPGSPCGGGGAAPRCGALAAVPEPLPRGRSRGRRAGRLPLHCGARRALICENELLFFFF